MDAKDIERYRWLSSQSAWHGKRAKGNNWHRRQLKWYNGQIGALPGIFTWIVSEAMRKHFGAIVANVTKSNALFERLKNGR